MDGTNSNAMAIKPIKAPIPEYFAFKGYFSSNEEENKTGRRN